MATGLSKGRVCVFGGAGFLGHALVCRLAKHGYDVVVPTRDRQRHRDLLVLPTVSVVSADIKDGTVVRSLVRDADAVVNLVGILNESRQHSFKAMHVELTRTIVEACLDAEVGRYLHVSALKASAERGPSDYLRSKGDAEKVVREMAGVALDYAIFQPSVVFGPGDGFINRFAGLMKAFPILPLAKPNARFAPVYVEDVALALHKVISSPRAGGAVYQLCGPQIYSLREILGLIGRTLNRRRTIVGLPDALAKIQASIMQWLPGKLFTPDNFKSLSVNSICSENGFKSLNIEPRRLDLVLPSFLAPPRRQSRLAAYRRRR